MVSSTCKESLELTPQAREFVEKVSLHYEIVYSLPRMGCRILALLLLVARPLRMESVERSLQVSHASISSNLRLLGMLGYVEKITRPGERGAYFRFQPRSRVRALQDRIAHYRELKAVLQDAGRELCLQGAASQGLEEMQAWADLAIQKNTQFITEWEAYLHRDSSSQAGN